MGINRDPFPVGTVIYVKTGERRFVGNEYWDTKSHSYPYKFVKISDGPLDQDPITMDAALAKLDKQFGKGNTEILTPEEANPEWTTYLRRR